jgi:hypothetical protein
MSLPGRRPLALALFAALALSGASAPAGKNASDAPVPVARGCPPERAQDGEVRLVFLGDSGYGTGFSEWGTHGQGAVAAQIEKLRLPPDMVFFLGDNIYWRGAASLYKARFDDVYDPLIRECKVHVALGNHDIKGCRAVEEYERWESCLQDLRASMVADRKARYMRQGMNEEAAEAKAKADTEAETAGDLKAEAVAGLKANCLPGSATAYENLSTRQTCNASTALAHAQFGFGSVEKGDPPASERQRYYSILWPLPRLTKGGSPTAPAEVATRPLVDVIVLDSNTLGVDGGMLEGPGKPPRSDQLQLLWLRNAMAQWLPAPAETHRIWKILAMHHPPYTPRSCACKIFGKCLGGHGDEPLLQKQLGEALEDLEPPDLVMTAHNHIYARSHPLDEAGLPVADPKKRGIRYFVAGGGGAPLYDVDRPDARFAKALTIYHFVYLRLTSTSAFYWTLDAGGKVRDSGCFEKGSGVDQPLAADFAYDDPLPARCAPPEG